MIRLLLILLFGIFLFGSDEKYQERPISTFVVADTISASLHVKRDSAGLPDGYEARIFTPVCETERCYAIEIILHWDLIGNYVKFDTLPGGELTKLDHIPFTKEDYQKLNSILSNNNSALGAYSKDELVKNSRTSALDGITGATIQGIKDAVINGAVYSCYTLWHIAHGPVVDSIQESTRRLLSKELVQKLIDLENAEVNYFLLNHLSSDDFILYLPEMLQSFELREGYYVKNAIEKLPLDFYKDHRVQGYFENSFKEMDYFSQVALLEKLSNIELEESLKDTLAKNLTERNSYRNELILSIVNQN
jgi:hypothetical protein